MRLLLTLFVVGLVLSLPAQELTRPQGCGYDHYVHSLDQHYVGFKSSIDEAFQQASYPSLEKSREVYTIPVVVHIVWQEEAQNLSNELVDEVIAVLNEDYRRLNADAELVRPIFNDVVGDPNIEFELVGIERVQTDTMFEMNLLGGSLPDYVKLSSEGGSDAWDPEKHLNIWVCNIEGGALLGYAYPPADLENWPDGANAPSPELDGVVIHHELFRRTGTYTTSGLFGLEDITVPVRGRTITHEVGHYLGLRHIWGDGLLSILGLPDCEADDGISDTPSQGVSSQFQCDPEQNTCSEEEEGDLPDMFENFMDYATEDCQNSFTLKQIDIMRGVLENQRSGLIGAVTTNVVAVEDSPDFKVFPNPAGEQLYIESSPDIPADYQLRLVDAQGRQVVSSLSGRHTDRQVVDVSGLPAGLYGLLIRQGDKQYFQKVVVQ